MTDRKTARGLLHIRGRLRNVDEIRARGRDAYLDDAMLQEAGDSLTMKLSESSRFASPLRMLRLGTGGRGTSAGLGNRPLDWRPRLALTGVGGHGS